MGRFADDVSSAWISVSTHVVIEFKYLFSDQRILWAWGTALAAAVTLLYFAARTYLIVECFISLAYLPEAVFAEPSWSKYLPHFGAG